MSKGEVQLNPKPIWVQPYLPGIDPDKPVEPEEPEPEVVIQP